MSTCHIGCDRVVVEFTVDIRPEPKRRARHGKGRTYTDPRTVAYENAIGLAARTAMKGANPITGDVELWCLFELRSARHAGDVDNMVKAIADALNGVAYVDDRQVTREHAGKVLRADVDRVSVAVLAVNA